MKKEFFEPEVEILEFEVSELKGIATSEDIENPVEPNPDWGWG